MTGIRVVRSDGTVEHDWVLVQEHDGRVLISKGDLLKNPTKILFDHWQRGGNARSTEELAFVCQVPKQVVNKWESEHDA